MKGRGFLQFFKKKKGEPNILMVNILGHVANFKVSQMWPSSDH